MTTLKPKYPKRGDPARREPVVLQYRIQTPRAHSRMIWRRVAFGVATYGAAVAVGALIMQSR